MWNWWRANLPGVIQESARNMYHVTSSVRWTAGADPRGRGRGLTSPFGEKYALFLGFPYELLIYWGTNCYSADYALDCEKKPLKIKHFPGGALQWNIQILSNFNPPSVSEKLGPPLDRDALMITTYLPSRPPDWLIDYLIDRLIDWLWHLLIVANPA